MCGIVGMIAKTSAGFKWKDKQMFRQMLLANTVRGDDSTGVFGVNKYGNLKMLKSAKPAQYLIDTKAYKDFEDEIFSKLRFVVGHNRASTRGATTDENAHPFIEDHICLIHNGTLTSHNHLAKTDVDSHAICKSFAERGHMETFPEIHGAYALIWYNAIEKRLYMARNTERPLWIIDTEAAIYIASEADMLLWLYKRVHGETAKTLYLKENNIYSWDLDQTDPLMTIRETPAKKALPLPVQSTLSQKVVEMYKTTAGTGSSNNSVFGKYKKGERILFDHVSNSVSGTNAYVRGETFDGKYKVSGQVSLEGLDADSVQALLEAPFLSGIIQGSSVPRGINHLIVANIEEAVGYNTINGDVVFDEDLQAAGWCCHECGTFIEPDEDDGKFWARIKNGVVKKLLCPTCVKDKPNLRSKSCTESSESSSSHTKLSADPLSDYETFSEGAACNFLH